MRLLRRLHDVVTAPVSIAPLAVARVLFGAAMTFSCVRFIALGWIEEQYIAPTWHFPYYGFEWVRSLGDPGMYLLYGAMTLAAIGVMLGAFYRVSIITFLLTFTYVELIDKTYYLNHYYFVSLAAALFSIVPAHRRFSLDVLRRPLLAVDTVPRWCVDVFKLQLGIVYVYAGIAKMTSSWLIDAMPMRLWMPANDTLPVIGPLMVIPWMPWVFAWTGMLFDTTVPFLLAWKRTRLVAYTAVVVFHTVTGMMFQIGVFPLVMIAMTLIFFDARLHQRVIGMSISAKPVHGHVTHQTWILRGLAIYVMLQVLIPWRFVLYPGELFWTEQGYRFSWRVMLMEKAGTATFYIRDRVTGREGAVNNADFLNAHQEKQMSMQPDMIIRYASLLHDHYAAHGVRDPYVRAEVWVTLNGAPSKLLVDSSIDLSAQREGFHNYAWILPRSN
ncbi:MAG: HTTM domain-containing protein [Candidatus Kapabacteria bacterium]|nr:HTTM domain-containing protein [Candidatus Kapabacteria bacterium]